MSLPALAVVLAALGLAMVARLSPALAQRQQLWIFVSLLLAIACAPPVHALSALCRIQVSLGRCLARTLRACCCSSVRKSTARGSGFELGPIQYEPIELIKLFIVLFLAAYLAETADVIANARWWSLRANVKYLGPLFIGWGASMAILVVQRDLGMATLLLATFAALLFVATRRLDIVLFGALLFALGAFWAVHHYPYVQTRIAVWLNPFSDPLGAGYQSSQAYYSLAAGGLVGSGYRLGHPEFIPDVATDYVYAAVAEEFGLIGALIVLAIFVDVVRRIFATGLAQPDLYSKLLAAGLAATLGFQVIIIVARGHRVATADRHHAAVHVVRRQLARCKFLTRRARLGDERATAEERMKVTILLVFAFAIVGCAKGANGSTAASASAAAAKNPGFGERRCRHLS